MLFGGVLWIGSVVGFAADAFGLLVLLRLRCGWLFCVNSVVMFCCLDVVLRLMGGFVVWAGVCVTC